MHIVFFFFFVGMDGFLIIILNVEKFHWSNKNYTQVTRIILITEILYRRNQKLDFLP